MRFNTLTPDPHLLQELTEAHLRVMHSGYFIGGPEVEGFEKEWAGYCGAKYCVSCGSGQQAITLTLKGLGIGPGDEVVAPAWTAHPTIKGIRDAGVVPRLVDVNVGTFLLYPEGVMNSRMDFAQVKAVMPVHLYGYQADIGYKNWPVIQDAAQAHGLKLQGTACWSFYPTKNLGGYGDGGAITTDDPDLVEYVRENRDSSRLDSLQAAFLRVKLGYLDILNSLRMANAIIYDDTLTQTPDLITPPLSGVMHQYVIKTQATRRDHLQAHLQGLGIETMVHYPVPAYQVLGGYDEGYPVANGLANRVLSLPITLDPEDTYRVARVINQYFEDAHVRE